MLHAFLFILSISAKIKNDCHLFIFAPAKRIVLSYGFAVWQWICAHPFFGVGFNLQSLLNSLSNTTGSHWYPHNIFLDAYGIGGLLLFIPLSVFVFRFVGQYGFNFFRVNCVISYIFFWHLFGSNPFFSHVSLGT